MVATPPNAVELTLQSVHGVVWKPDKYAGEENLVKRVKACVAFSSSAPNMQVSSFTMCPRTGKLVVESNCLEAVAAGVEPTAADQASGSQQTMSARFDDPLEASQAKQQRPLLSSSHSTSSGTSSSSCRPHLQFELPDEASKEKATSDNDKYQEGIVASASSGSERSIELQISLRSDDPEASSIRHEGVAVLNIPAKFENLPISLDLPITSRPDSDHDDSSSAGSLVEKSEMLNFDSSAYIRVVLCLTAHRLQRLSQNPSSTQPELVLSDNLDMLQLGGMMKIMHEKEEIEDAQARAATLLQSPSNDMNEQKRRNSAFLCNSSSELGGSFQTFFDVLKGCGGHRKNLKTKDLSQDLFLNATMASTIDTRDSLEI